MNERKPKPGSPKPQSKDTGQGAAPRASGPAMPNGAAGGPALPSGGGNGAFPGNGAPPGSGGGGGEGSLRDRVTTLEASMATKSGLHKVETNLRGELHETEARLRKDFGEAIEASEGRLRGEVKASEERLRGEVQASEKRLREETKAAEGRLDKRLDKLTTVLMWGAGVLVALLLTVIQMVS